MNIRRAEQKDVDVVVKLFHQYRQFYGQHSDVRAEQAFIQQRIERQESIIYIAYFDGEAAGFVQLYPTFSSVSMQRAYILNDLFVDEAFRQKGIAQALIERCFTLCEEQHAKYVKLETASNNIHAQQLYEKMGMTRECTFWSYTKSW